MLQWVEIHFGEAMLFLCLLLDIFANAVTPQEYLTGEPMKFKSVCKFKIVCDDLQTVMVPLPDCASGEWGKDIC